VEDTETKEWLSRNMVTFELEQTNKANTDNGKFALITIHDVTPHFSDRVLRAGDSLSQLGMSFNLAIIPRFMQKQEYDLRNNIEWLKEDFHYEQPSALHGLYHEDQNGKIEDFHNFDFNRALNDMRDGLEIFSKAGLRTDIFVPPAWAVNKNTIDATLQLGLTMAETDEEILLLKNKTRLSAGVLNWDQGSDERNRLFLKINKQLFKDKLIKNSKMVRIAIHPKDPEEALNDQKEMIQALKDRDYEFITYEGLNTIFDEVKHN
jgi:predicted deacetylase